jgi:cytochrome c2
MAQAPKTQAPKKVPDRHYDFRGLNIVFFWSSVALLLVTLLMVYYDYAKPWKRLQSEFRDLEQQKLLAEAEAERQSLNENEIAQISAEIEAEETALGGQAQEIQELEKSFDALDKKVYAADATARTTKSLLDTARYGLDVALQSGVDRKMTAAREEVADLEATYFENRKQLEAYIEQRDGVREDINQKQAGRAEAEKRLAALRSGLDALQQRVAGLDKKIDYFVLNAPLMDFIEPDLKIEQVILSGLFQDINFTAVDRVDRCMTCHVAAGRSGFDSEEWAEPFRSHPRLDLFVGASSPHPYTEFGCTTCHGGLDRATDFARAGHSPRTEEQKAEWIERWGWAPQKYLEDPILPGGLSEARCNSCHADNVWTPGSEQLEVGRELISRMGCFGCHLIDYPAYREMPRPGPTLKGVASKTNPGWTYRWIEAPREFRPTTWMPHFFFQENIVGELNEERQRAEIRGLVSYIWDRSDSLEYPPAPSGDAANGELLFNSIGCTGCHLRDGEATRDQFFPQINRMHGPNLVNAGSKLDPDWLFAWLKNPKEYNPDTRMPSLRLTDREAADLVAYLMSSRDPAFENLEMPTVDGEVRDDLVKGYLQNTQTIEQSEATLADMSDRERDVYLGGQTIRKYGCFACHEVEGFDDAKPIGVELTEEGSKPIHQFDFGHIHDIPHTRQDWIRTKMLRPRIWDHGKEEVKGYHELYRMPNFGMSEREAEAVVTNVLGFTEESVLASRRAGRSAADAALAEGRKLITRYNCQGCHLVEAKGHAIRTSIEDVGMLPPNLAAEGARVQSEWLFGYLHDPGKVSLRPWLSVRMPTFGFRDGDVNTLLSYFSARESREPFLSPPARPDARNLAVGQTAFNMFQCAKCHPAGPQPAGGAVSAGELAPSLLLARERLRHDWVADWIKDPQSWVPGTKMPANFTRLESGEYQSPLANAVDAPMFSAQKKSMMRHFSSEEELKEFLADTDQVTGALRDHIFWNLEGGP